MIFRLIFLFNLGKRERSTQAFIWFFMGPDGAHTDPVCCGREVLHESGVSGTEVVRKAKGCE